MPAARDSFDKVRIDVAVSFSAKQDPEDGGIYTREHLYLQATNPYGYRRAFGGLRFTSEEQALREFAIGIVPSVHDDSAWHDAGPEYGSWAYQFEGTEEHLAEREREDDRLGLNDGLLARVC